jgi:diacylglycerol O-acyltransferase
MICTNVPGSPVPLYAVGRRLIASYPQVPTGYELGVGCAVQSYDGRLFFGLIADAHVASDVHRLRDFLYVAFDELRRAAGLKKSPRRTTKRAKPHDLAADKALQPELVSAAS